MRKDFVFFGTVFFFTVAIALGMCVWMQLYTLYDDRKDFLSFLRALGVCAFELMPVMGSFFFFFIILESMGFKYRRHLAKDYR